MDAFKAQRRSQPPLLPARVFADATATGDVLKAVGKLLLKQPLPYPLILFGLTNAWNAITIPQTSSKDLSMSRSIASLLISSGTDTESLGDSTRSLDTCNEVGATLRTATPIKGTDELLGGLADSLRVVCS